MSLFVRAAIGKAEWLACWNEGKPVGSVLSSYANLKRLFGEPDADSSEKMNSRITMTWMIEGPGKSELLLFDWKAGVLYTGTLGEELRERDGLEFHIRSRSEIDVAGFYQFLERNGAGRRAPTPQELAELDKNSDEYQNQV